MEDCIFCKIAKGEIPTRVIYEDDKVIAFLDITPYEEGHTLLIPKEHYRWIWDMPEDLNSHFNQVASKIAKEYQKISKDELVYTLTIGMLVDHCHLHLIPNTTGRYTKNLNEILSKSRMQLNDDQFDKIHKKFKV